MTCPADLVNVLTEMLAQGLLQARAAGWAGDGTGAAVEADHVHNLPGLLADYSPDRLRYYWDAERPAYVSRATPDRSAAFRPLWDRLRRHVERLPATAAAG